MLGKEPAAGERVSCWLLSVTSVPARRTGDDSAIAETTASCFVLSATGRSAPVTPRSTMRYAEPEAAATRTAYVPGVRFVNAKRPCGVVCVWAVTLSPTA